MNNVSHCQNIRVGKSYLSQLVRSAITPFRAVSRGLGLLGRSRNGALRPAFGRYSFSPNFHYRMLAYYQLPLGAAPADTTRARGATEPHASQPFAAPLVRNKMTSGGVTGKNATTPKLSPRVHPSQLPASHSTQRGESDTPTALYDISQQGINGQGINGNSINGQRINGQLIEVAGQGKQRPLPNKPIAHRSAIDTTVLEIPSLTDSLSGQKPHSEKNTTPNHGLQTVLTAWQHKLNENEGETNSQKSGEYSTPVGQNTSMAEKLRAMQHLSTTQSIEALSKQLEANNFGRNENVEPVPKPAPKIVVKATVLVAKKVTAEKGLVTAALGPSRTTAMADTTKMPRSRGAKFSGGQPFSSMKPTTTAQEISCVYVKTPQNGRGHDDDKFQQESQSDKRRHWRKPTRKQSETTATRDAAPVSRRITPSYSTRSPAFWDRSNLSRMYIRLYR